MRCQWDADDGARSLDAYIHRICTPLGLSSRTKHRQHTPNNQKKTPLTILNLRQRRHLPPTPSLPKVTNMNRHPRHPRKPKAARLHRVVVRGLMMQPQRLRTRLDPPKVRDPRPPRRLPQPLKRLERRLPPRFPFLATFPFLGGDGARGASGEVEEDVPRAAGCVGAAAGLGGRVGGECSGGLGGEGAAGGPFRGGDRDVGGEGVRRRACGCGRRGIDGRDGASVARVGRRVRESGCVRRGAGAQGCGWCLVITARHSGSVWLLSGIRWWCLLHLVSQAATGAVGRRRISRRILASAVSLMSKEGPGSDAGTSAPFEGSSCRARAKTTRRRINWWSAHNVFTLSRAPLGHRPIMACPAPSTSVGRRPWGKVEIENGGGGCHGCRT